MAFSISSAYSSLRTQLESAPNDALPTSSAVKAAHNSLPSTLPAHGLGENATAIHMLQDLTPGFNGPKTSANYYGFVTGGVLPIAEFADNIVAAYDQNVAAHLPDQSISTVVEDRALQMLVELLHLGSPAEWQGRTFTTGATGSNVLGLAIGRESVVSSRLKALGEQGSVGQLGLLTACLKAKVTGIQVLTSMGHSSLSKAASIVGLGRDSVQEIGLESEPWKLDVELLEHHLQKASQGIVSIVSISAGEVNTGRFATDGVETMRKIRSLCDQYSAWLHVDGAFGLFARCLPQTPEFSYLHASTSGLELADSIGGDCHKLLNVPYDCGFFLTRSSSLSSTFQNPNAAYLSSGPSHIPSPLNTGLENSRRFRALPVYAVLLAYGREGLQEIFAAQVRLVRAIAEFLAKDSRFELLPAAEFDKVHIVVLFRAVDDKLNQGLVDRINGIRRVYVSGTKWQGRSAVRIAVSTWKVDVQRDLEVVKGVIEGVAAV